jgi:hypothetical protein
LRFSLERSFEQFWADQLAAVSPIESESQAEQIIPHAKR